MEVKPVTITDPKFWKWSDQRLDATFGTSPTRSIVTRRSGKSQIDQSFWENVTKVMGSIMCHENIDNIKVAKACSGTVCIGGMAK